MKHLIVVRHGKTEPYHEDGDMARALTHRGVNDSERMGKLIRDTIGNVDLVVSSPAVRAAQTARIVAKAVDYKGEIDWQPDMYGASVNVLFALVSALPEVAGSAVLVGHNPGLEELVEGLTGGDLPGDHLPTAGVAHITLDGPWSEAGLRSGILAGNYSPKTVC